MIFNVAQLLKSPVGATQDTLLDDNDRLELLDNEARLAGPINGRVRLHRTNQGVYVGGVARVPVTLECSRCLKEFTTTLDLPLRETFYPTIDIETGLPLKADEGEESFQIDDHHQVDLREAIRQRLVLEIPMQPLHSPDCKGLCPECGRDLNLEPHAHEEEQGDERFAALRQLLEAD